MEVEALLRADRALQASTPAISMIEKQLPEASALIGLELERTLSLLREQPTLETLEMEQEALGKAAAPDHHLAGCAHATDHPPPGGPDPPGGPAADVDPDPGRRARGKGAGAGARADRRGPRRDRRGADAATDRARGRARSPEPCRPGGGPLSDGAGADRRGADAGDGRAPGAGASADLERRVVGARADRRRSHRPRHRRSTGGAEFVQGTSAIPPTA